MTILQLGKPTARQKADLCAAFQLAAVSQLVSKTERACVWGKELLGSRLKHLVCFAMMSHFSSYIIMSIYRSFVEELQAISIYFAV